MKKLKNSDFTNPRVLIILIMLTAVVVLILDAYFIKPLKQESTKYAVTLEEKTELQLLTEAYLRENKDLKLDDSLVKNYDINTYGNKFRVAASYYFLKYYKENEEVIVDYEQIEEIAKKIYNTKNVVFSNIVINIDEFKCGIQKYSSLEGIINSDVCDLNDLVYEIKDIYKEGKNYIVEFYAAKATQSLVEPEAKCEKFETSLTYNLKISDLEDSEYYNENYSRCCHEDEECVINGVYYLKNEILNQTRIHDHVYKMIFIKKNDNFIYHQLKR